jgi:hypothetical protein
MQGVAAPRSYGRVRNSTIQRNVDDETTYETSEMKPPKRPGLASSWQRRSSPQRGVVTLFDNTHQPIPSPPVPCRPQPLGLNGHLTADFALYLLLAPSPTSSQLAEHRPPRALFSCACRPRLDINISQQGARAPPTNPPLSGRDGEWASPLLM